MTVTNLREVPPATFTGDCTRWCCVARRIPHQLAVFAFAVRAATVIAWQERHR